jgi:hypothetical protein
MWGLKMPDDENWNNPESRNWEAYDAGREAFRRGLNDSDNPHPIGSDDAMDWFDGLTDEENGA